ncbi:MAG: hypothetical protein U9Q06_00175 [Nanoarchaeota archaeon]|nr:hypothetical protein [Nanoarchaeota archaeon]
MVRFNFEKNLEHQEQAVKSTVGVFDSVEIIKPEGVKKEYINSSFDKNANFKYVQNIRNIQEQNSIERNVKGKKRIKRKGHGKGGSREIIN